MWILAITLLVVFAAIGFGQGAIRSAISLVGMILALLLAVPVGGMLKPLMSPLGVTNPVWLALIPPLIAFALIYLVISGLSFFVHHKIYLIYKYKRDDVDRLRWERVNRHAGAAVGVLTGAIFFLAVSGLIYAAGYLTVQLSAEDNNPASIRFINSVRQDMADSGFDKTAAKFEPASNMYYETADILGLLYHNPLLQSRLTTYPYFLSLSEKPEFQELGNDKEYNDLVFGKAPVTQIIDHARTQAILGNAEVMSYLKGADRKDLLEYLRTGKSPKYAEQGILGVWNLDKGAVLTFLRKSNPDIKSKDLRLLKQALELVPTISLLAMPDNKVVVKGEAAAAPAPAEESAEAAPVDPLVARYGPEYARRMQAGAVPPAAVTNKAPETAVAPVPKLSGQGTWSEEAGQYVVTLSDPTGKEVKGTAKVNADELLLTIGGTSLVFAKQ